MVYASTIHCSCVWLARRSRTSVGRATLRTVLSIPITRSERQRTQSVHQRREEMDAASMRPSPFRNETLPFLNGAGPRSIPKGGDFLTQGGARSGEGRTPPRSDAQELAGAGVGAGVAKLGHRPGFDLTDPLAGQVEALADLFEGPGLTTVESEPESEDLALAFIQRLQEPRDLLREEPLRLRLERRFGGGIAHHVGQHPVALPAQRLRQRERVARVHDDVG